MEINQFTLTRPGVQHLTLNRETRVVSVVKEQRVLAVTLAKTGVNVTQNLTGTTGYQHSQTTPASQWVIAHNLGYRPGGIVVIDSAGTQWLAEVQYTDVNNLILHFGPASFSGVAYIS